MPIFGGEKPSTSVTVKVNQLCTPNRNSDLGDDSMEIYLDQLIALIKLQSTGASEAARAIRKKIKYGNSADEMLLASNLLELMVLNAGPKIGRQIASDDRLAELLRNIVSGNATTGAGVAYDPAVVRRFRNLAVGWRSEFHDLDGYKPLATLWKAVPRKGKARGAPDHGARSPDPISSRSPGPVSSRLRPSSPLGPDSDDDAGLDYASTKKSPAPPRPRTMSPYTIQKSERRNDSGRTKESPGWGFSKKSHKSKKPTRKGRYADEEYKIPQINYKVEAPKIRDTIARCHTHTTALTNILLTLPESVTPLDDARAAAEFDKCRKIRRLVLRYLQFVGAGNSADKSAEIAELDEEFLGALIVANDQLVAVFTRFDQLSGYTPENPAAYHDESPSSAESYYSESDDESLADRLQDVHVHESSSRLAEAVERPSPEPSLEPAHPRPPAIRQDTGFSVGTAGTAGSDPFGDPFGDKNSSAF